MHHLAAILFIDIVGYTAMMEESEERALDAVRKLNEISKPLAAEHDGTWHKDLGDGTLFSFGSALEAVRCAIEIQQKVNLNEAFKTRIGIHVGDITFEDQDVFGDGVNIAARIQGESAVGGIAISDAVHSNIKNKNGIVTRSLGRRKLKNVEGEIKLFQIKAPGVETLKKRARSYQAVVFCVIGLLAGYSINEWLSPGSSINNNDELRVNRYSLTFPESLPIELIGTAPYGAGQRAFDISPDGSLFVYVTNTVNGPMLAMRPSDSFDVKILEGTEGAFYPFFSPDGQWIAYFTNKQLLRIRISGIRPEVITNTTSPKGGFWNKNDQIIFSDEDGASIKIISALGSKTTPVNVPFENANFYYWPAPLPVENYIMLSGGGRIYLCNIETGKVDLLVSEGSTPKYVEPGLIVYSKEGTLKTVRFDKRKLAVTGTPITVIENARSEAIRKGSQFALSNSGKLIYARGSAVDEGLLVFVDRNGIERDTLPIPPENFGSYSLSPDMDHVLFISNKNSGLYLYEIERNIITKISDRRGFHVWSHDGRSFAYNTIANGKYVIIRQSVDNSQVDTLYRSDQWLGIYSWSKDERFMALVQIDQNSMRNLVYLDFDQVDPVPQVLTAQPYHEIFAHISPNGEYYVYAEETKSGEAEIFLRKFPSSEQKIKITSGGGSEPYWTSDGQEILYMSSDYKRMISVTVSWDNGPKLSSPKTLWEGPYIDIPGRSFSLSPDGSLFLMKKSLEQEHTRNELLVVDNWTFELKEILED